MSTKYGKKVLIEHQLSMPMEYCLEALEALVVLDNDKKYYNIHIISPHFNDDEMNTLDYQQPVENGVPTELELITAIYRHHIWYLHDVDVELTLTKRED